MINRLQNVVITLDKVKMVLQAPNQVRHSWGLHLLCPKSIESLEISRFCFASPTPAVASGSLLEDINGCRGRGPPLVRSEVSSRMATQLDAVLR